ncbi:SGNH/GDSL hydrolase family protein [Pseudidiomarina sp. CB1]|uniref:SGNH/GDSL hydrolase family protein n=1 Tax=Pseudidiomarina sp. CB1 TaxID=2972484 RepID=UPI0021618E78|nr:SGNH/GDSL hydrolase family protein [Pseudidiomarina sp. CB1]
MRKLLFALAAPLLLVQGKRVRQRTPRLPEPPGPRHGQREGGKPALSLLLIGDSAIAGVGCDAQAEAVTGKLVAALSEHCALEWQLVAQSSLTCAKVLALLQGTELRIAAPDAVLISVGVNDVTKRTSVRQWRTDLENLTHYLSAQLGAKKIIYTSLPPMHKFPALPQPLRWFVGQQAMELNHHLETHCQTHANTELLKFDLPYAPEFIAADGYHPSAQAAAIWAQAAENMIMEFQ